MTTVSNGYCTLAELKNQIQSDGNQTAFTPDDDSNLAIAINAASRAIDTGPRGFDNTSFYARTETRYYTAEFHDLLWIDDLISITTLKTDDDDNGTYETTWATTDYYTEPRNAASGSTVQPYRQIRVNQNGNYSFPTNLYGVEIAGSWGYCTAANRPPQITQACILMAHRLWKRKDAVFGIAGTPGLGVTTVVAQIKQDSDIQFLLSSVNWRGF